METSKADVLSEDSKIRKVLQGISFFAVVAVLLLNVYNQNRIIHRLRETGGDGMWAYEMTTLAEDALEHKERGDKEVYVFYDWGFMTGFNYLTENRVPIVANWDLGILSQYYNEGNDIVICYWEKEKEGTNKTILDLTANFTGKIENSAVKDKNGRVEFYKMTLFHQK